MTILRYIAPSMWPKPAASRLPLSRSVLLLSLLFMAGCGEVEWFPEYKREPTTPDQFSFAARKGVEKNEEVSSESITVSGITGGSSPISITGSTGSNSKYSIDGKSATSSPGTVENGAKVSVTHTSANTLGGTTSSTLTIGNISATFFSTTQLVETPLFPKATLQNGFMQTSVIVTSRDGSAPHVISIKDSANSTNAQFAVTDGDQGPNFFLGQTQTIGTLNNRRIWVRNLPSTTVMTTLTINDVAIPVVLSGL